MDIIYRKGIWHWGKNVVYILIRNYPLLLPRTALLGPLWYLQVMNTINAINPYYKKGIESRISGARARRLKNKFSHPQNL